MTLQFAVESRIVAYEEGKELPHVFAASNAAVILDQLDNSQQTVDAFSEAARGNTEQLLTLLETALHKDHPQFADPYESAKLVDVNVLRAVLKALDENRARIVSSAMTHSEPADPAWYCIKVKKL